MTTGMVPQPAKIGNSPSVLEDAGMVMLVATGDMVLRRLLCFVHNFEIPDSAIRRHADFPSLRISDIKD